MLRNITTIGLVSVLVWQMTASHSPLCPLPLYAEERQPSSNDAATDVEKPQRPKTMESEHLPNLVILHPKVISGGLPEGDKAFQELKKFGVKTIITVDGATPDVETAKKHGLRYVHLPHGYDGIPKQRIKELAKAVRELDGPIYVHCHHGKHRSPAAASAACVAAGLISNAEGQYVLEIAGTSPNYVGLFQSVKETAPLDHAMLDAFNVEFKEIADIPPMAAAMVEIEHTYGHLKKIEDANWRTPKDHPDLIPAHEALLLREHFTELLRAEESQDESKEFRQYLRDTEKTAQKLEKQLRAWNPANSDEAPPKSFGQLTAKMTRNCAVCHNDYRGAPLGKQRR